MSDVKTSENFHGQDEYHRAYFHDIDAPAPLKKDRVDPNLPDLDKEEAADPEAPEAPSKSGRESEPSSRETRSQSGKADSPKESASRAQSSK